MQHGYSPLASALLRKRTLHTVFATSYGSTEQKIKLGGNIMTISIILSIILLGAAFVLFFYTADKYTASLIKTIALVIYGVVAIGALVNIIVQALSF